MGSIQRNSSFELLRIISQYMIVAYHILLMWFFIKGPNPDLIYKALWVPLHIAVPIFVIISGYFGIRFSLKGLLRLVAPVFVYGLGFYILSHFLYGNELKPSGFFFMSNTPYWFIRTYLFLYLLSPLINRVIAGMTLTVRVITLVILAWISCWCGLMGFDASMNEGCNVVHFALMYLIGNTLCLYKDKLNAIPTWVVATAYLVVAISTTIIAYIGMRYTHITIIFHLMFEYNSVVLLLHAVLFFMLFMRMNIQSRFINYCATSSLAIYLLHCTDVVMGHWMRDVAFRIQEMTSSVPLQVMMVLGEAFVVVVGCIAFDKLFTPLWKLTNKLGDKLNESRLGVLISEYR